MNSYKNEDMPPTCRYEFQPTEWAEAHDEPSPLQEEWSCPRDAVEDAEFCPFHLSPDERANAGINSEELSQQLRSELVSKDSPSLRLVGATLPGFDISTLVIDRPTNNPIDLRHATIEGNLQAVEAAIHQPLLLEQATINGQVDVSGAEFGYAVHCDGIDIRGSCTFEDVTFADTVSFREGTVRREITFKGSEFQRKADFYGFEAVANSVFRNTVWEMDCLFQSARFDGRADFFSATFHQLADFRGVTFEGVSRFSKSEFEREALFLDADFDRAALFKKFGSSPMHTSSRLILPPRPLSQKRPLAARRNSNSLSLTEKCRSRM
ncbi:pentapeptide repeat-containing protein [Halonotius sp. GCM10025705]|uniref:pentapeptide repeat-containing protein n=1 Tax=Halonotius sp. GCM10025705 TaxID=3252678 RepID=UPI0036213B58